VVASAIGETLEAIEYPNVKNSVDDDALHGAYSKVWGVKANFQGKSIPMARSRERASTRVPVRTGRR
jgi:hypothetical protein